MRMNWWHMVWAVMLVLATGPGQAHEPGGLTLYMTQIPGQTMIDDTEPGTALEIARAAAMRAGVKLAERFLPWNRAVNAVETGTDGIIVPFSRTPDRAGRFTWIGVLYDLQFGFISLYKPIDSKQAARRLQRIGVWRGTSMEEELRREGFDNLVPVSNDQALARMLVRGRFDAWYGSINEAAYMFRGIEYLNRARIRYGKAVNAYPVWLAGGLDFPKPVAKRLREALRELRRDGTVAAIMARYGM